MKVLEFRLLTPDDEYGVKFNDGSAWSRVYEYPIALNKLRQYGANVDSTIHNSSWGWDDIHMRFKSSLDQEYPQTIHSDIRGSSLPKTFIYNITLPPSPQLTGKFDFVINISTVEEVPFNHAQIIHNLYAQLKEGGYLIITFDYPGLDRGLIENTFNCRLHIPELPLNGSNSKLQNLRYSHLNCGILVIQK